MVVEKQGVRYLENVDNSLERHEVECVTCGVECVRQTV